MYKLSTAQLTEQLAKTRAKVSTYTSFANDTFRVEGETSLNKMYLGKDPRFEDFKLRGKFPKDIQPQNAPDESDNPAHSLPLNKGMHRSLGLAQTKVPKNHYAILAHLARQQKQPQQARSPSPEDREAAERRAA